MVAPPVASKSFEDLLIEEHRKLGIAGAKGPRPPASGAPVISHLILLPAVAATVSTALRGGLTPPVLERIANDYRGAAGTTRDARARVLSMFIETCLRQGERKHLMDLGERIHQLAAAA